MALSLSVSALAASLIAQAADHSHPPRLGNVHFESSCNAAAGAALTRGLGWLHSFEYEPAKESFIEAASADPRCAIAHWGVAMTYYHPLWAAPSQAELASGRQALERAREIGASTERERAYIAALGSFYDDSDRLDHKTRVLAYSRAMAGVHERFPDDHEAAVFYALTLIAAGTMDNDPAFAMERAAGAILNRVLARAPEHPGVTHYLIHSFDYPPLAGLALAAARNYASIAPASPHAQHMPSHIFVRLGLWDEVIRSNLASEAAAKAMARAQGLPDSSSERLHAMDYLAYGYLQTGRDDQAQRVLQDLNEIRRADPPILAVAYAATAIPARLTLERRQWAEAASLELPESVRNLAPLENFRWRDSHIHFARAVGAARRGDAAAARSEVERMRAIEDSLTIAPGTYDWRTQVAIERQIAEAWLARAEGRNEEAIRLMRSAADLDDSAEKHPVTPGAILPAREQLAELLLELGNPREALTEYESALTRTPRRLAGLYGAARAARQSGNSEKARTYYSQIIETTRGSPGTRGEIREAATFLGL